MRNFELSGRKVLIEKVSVILKNWWLCLLLVGGACQQQPHDEVMVKVKEKEYNRHLKEVAQGQLTPVLFDPDYRLVSDMAMLSANVYSGARTATNRPDYGEDLAKYAVVRAELGLRGWEQYDAYDNPLEPPRAQTKSGGLVYDVWIRNVTGAVPVVALVFRGTDSRQLHDWLANAHPVTNTPSRWDQYEQAHALTKDLVAHLDSAFGKNNVRVFATGHSLGGGLAQRAGHASLRIEKVFAFNSSPLTGYYDTARRGRLRYEKGRRTYLVYESKEILSIPRKVPIYLNRFATERDMVVVRYNFSEKVNRLKPVHQHGALHLVAGLSRK